MSNELHATETRTAGDSQITKVTSTKKTVSGVLKNPIDVNLLGGSGPAAGIEYDFLDVQQTDATTETYVFKTGGSGGTTVLTIVIVYVLSDKVDINTVTWT